MPQLITLVPNSGVQFWDVDLDLERMPNRRRSFWEERLSDVPGGNGQVPVILRLLVEDDITRELADPVTGRIPPEEAIYAIGRPQALETFVGKWVPMPYFLRLARRPDGREDCDQGPTNWVRARLTEATKSGGARLTLAFDTALLPRRDGPYTAPAPEDTAQQNEFVFIANPDSNGWFLNEGWLGDWLQEMLRELQLAKRAGRPLAHEDLRHACEHLARYIVFLDLLDQSGVMPRLQLLNTISANLGDHPVAVDLVLDVGNARTCGVLIEEHPGQGMNLTDSYSLALRDLTRPELVHDKPFDSRVEFAYARFGRDALSRRSGRGGAFAWPSPMRVGPEAVRLAGSRLGNEGATGLSSPKRYLWDERLTTQGWRFNGLGPDGVTTDPPITGSLMPLVAEDGTVLRGRSGLRPAVRARFSRSSLFSFMLTEILLQALCQINAPATRMNRRDANKPRRLRRVLLTLPPGMPVFEQQLLRMRAAAAVRLAWDLLGWTAQEGMPREPKVIANLDEATATQIVWLHNEVAERFAGDSGGLMRTLGRDRPDIGVGLSLRVASIDIGGGTTDLMVTTFTLPQGELIVPTQEFRESFKIAGDDVLQRVIVTIVVPALAAALEKKGVPAPRDLLTRALGQDLSGQSEQDRHARRVFVGQVLEPIGLAMMQAYERIEKGGAGEIAPNTIGAIMAQAGELEAKSIERLCRPLEQAAEAAGASNFRVADVEIATDARRVDAAVRAVLGRALGDLCEVVWHYDCDVLLLSGRPSRLKAVLDIVHAKAPVAPHRVIGMHRYRVGERYPFRDAANRIDDPKTTAAVGAMLCVQAEGRLRNFMLRASQLTMKSTARIIGRMDNDGQIRKENELIPAAELDQAPSTNGAAADDFTMQFQSTVQLGFRQLPIARWTATPLYVMEFADPDTAPRLALPLKVRVVRREEDPDSARYEAAREKFEVEEIEDATGARLSNRDVTLRLQTIDDQDGYWRDPGRIAMQ
jgi:hypothetical protein